MGLHYKTNTNNNTSDHISRVTRIFYSDITHAVEKIPQTFNNLNFKWHDIIIIIIIIIIIVSIWQATLRRFRSSNFAKKEGTIQYGYRK